jgi:hypothetical protein
MSKDLFWEGIYRLEATADRCDVIAGRDTWRVANDDWEDILAASLALSVMFPSHDGVEVRAAPCAMDMLAQQCRVLKEGEKVPIQWSHRHWLTDAAKQLRREASKRRDCDAERKATGL